MKVRFLIPLAFLLAGCVTADPYDRAPMRRHAPVVPGLEMMPPPEWWRDAELAREIRLTGDQRDQLRELYASHANELETINSDTAEASRELRRLLDDETFSTDEIEEAAQQVKSLRDTAFEQQLQLLLEQRRVLTQDQWEELQDILDIRRNYSRWRDDPYGRRIGGGYYPRW